MSWMPVIAVLAVTVAAFLLYQTLSEYSYEEILGSVFAIPMSKLATALGFTATSYLCLTFFDYFALHYAGRPLSYGKAARASFTALSIGHNVGFALSSAAIRYRYYARWGLSNEQVAKVVIFCGATVSIGLLSLGGLAFLLQPDLASKYTGYSRVIMLALGVAATAIIVTYLVCAAWTQKPLKIMRWSFEMPSLKLATAQLFFGSLNFALVAAALHQTISAFADVSFFRTSSVFVIANAAGVIAHVPGGLGVIEAVVLQLMPDVNLIGALLAFRVAYYFLPLLVGSAVLAINELYGFAKLVHAKNWQLRSRLSSEEVKNPFRIEY